MHTPPHQDDTSGARRHRRPGPLERRSPGWRRGGRLAVVALLLTGCAATSPETAAVIIDSEVHLVVELARTTDQQRLGLAGRDRLPAGTGMLFEFDPPGPRRVWMAGMTFTIDIAWISDGRVIATDTLAPCTAPDTDECPRWQSPGDVDALLETGAGTLDHIEPGASITIEPATQPSVIQGRRRTLP